VILFDRVGTNSVKGGGMDWERGCEAGPHTHEGGGGKGEAVPAKKLVGGVAPGGEKQKKLRVEEISRRECATDHLSRIIW